jgi:hypothetical protein
MDIIYEDDAGLWDGESVFLMAVICDAVVCQSFCVKNECSSTRFRVLDQDDPFLSLSLAHTNTYSRSFSLSLSFFQCSHLNGSLVF